MPIIGIDLGTTNSLVTVWQEGKSVVIPNSFGKYLTPSVVSINDDGSVVTGEIAKQRLISHPGRTVSLFKQFMGTAQKFNFNNIKNEKAPHDNISFSAEELSSFILRSLKNDAEAFLKEEVTEAIISVPAYFNDKQRYATKAAGLLAGLKVDRILNEPSAAALAYRQYGICDGTNIVFDFGGGTLDVSVLDSFDTVVDILAVAGNNRLGGSDIDALIAEAFLKEHEELREQLSEEQSGILLKIAENCKIALSGNPQAFMVLNHNGKDYLMVIDNEKLMNICEPVLVKFNQVIKRAVLNAEKSLFNIDNVILVGGSCRMPLVKEYLQHVTKKTVLSEIDPDFAVAYGVGTAAGIKERNEEIRDMILMDVCPFSLGVNTSVSGKKDDIFSVIIPRNCALPASRLEKYNTLSDLQKSMSFKVYQGESVIASQNLLLGQYTIPVPPLPKGEAVVSVRFSYDINGILDIEFKCEQTEEVYKKIIISNDRLSEKDIKEHLKKLEKFALNAKENDENMMLIAHGQRLLEEFTGSIQNDIRGKLIMFETELEESPISAKVLRIKKSLKEYFEGLDEYAENILLYGQADYYEWDEYDDEDYDENEEESKL